MIFMIISIPIDNFLILIIFSLLITNKYDVLAIYRINLLKQILLFFNYNSFSESTDSINN